MPSPTFDKQVIQIQDALQKYQPAAAISQLTALLKRKLPPAQQALTHGLLAQAYEFTSQWTEAETLLRPYEVRARCTELPLATHQFLCLRLAALRTEQGDLPTAIHFARQALHLAELAADPRAQGEAQQALGKIYRLLGQPAFARQHYQAALNLHQTLGARVLMAWSYFGLGTVATGCSEYAVARQALTRAFHLVSEEDDPLLYGLLCGMQASTLVLEEAGTLAERLAWFERAQTAFERIAQRRLLARTLGNHGAQLLTIGRWQAAQTLFQQALELGQELNDQRSVANVLESLAELHTRQGKYEISQRYLAEALSWVEGLDHFVEAQVRLAMARLLHWQGQWEQARQACEQVIAIAVPSDAKQLFASAQLYLAEIALEEGCVATAEALLHEHQPTIERLQSVGMVGHLRFVAGRLALAQAQWAEARTLLEQAHSIFAVSGRCWWLGRTQFALATALVQQGQMETAHSTMKEAQQHFHTLAAQPWLQQIKRWFANHPLPSTATAQAANSQTEITPLLHTEAEGVSRLLQATISPDVLLRELLTLLQHQLPQTTITFYETSEAGNKQILIEHVAQSASVAKSQVFRLEPLHCPAFYVSLTPAPATPRRISPLLKAAEIGLEVCAARTRASFFSVYEQQDERIERRLPGLLYQSQAMRELAAQIHHIKGSEVTVLITGESGTGKELVAQAIHALSQRTAQPFLPFNCANLSADRAEAQLFGHQRGAFTGAVNRSEGVIRAADHGTLFLDEVGELPGEVQPKLLRFLQCGEIHPLGESRPQQVNVRVIAATNRPLEELVKTGQFRADLFYRLNVIRLQVPPLRARREEIPLLANHFLAQHAQAANKPSLQLTLEALDALMIYDWPGNVRQLENEIQRLVAFARAGSWLPLTALSAELRPRPTRNLSGKRRQANEIPAPPSLKAILTEVERTTIAETLTRCQGKVSQAATELQLSRGSLYAKLERFGIALPTA